MSASRLVSDFKSDTLPLGWATGTIGELIAHDGVFSDGDWVETKDQDPNGGVRLTQLADVGEGSFRDRSERFLREDQAASLNCTFLRQGDVLIARMPDPLGRACIFPGLSQPAVTAVDVCIVRAGSGSVDPRWLMWTINAPQFRRRVLELQSGTTRRRISRKNLATIEFPVPPLNEQRRVVAAIEEHLSRLDAADASLAVAAARVVILRRSVFRASVSADAPGVTLSNVAVVASGQTPKGLETTADGAIPYYKVGDMNLANGHRMSVAREYVSEDEVSRVKLRVHPPGSVIFPKRGGAIATNKKRILTSAAALDLNTMAVIPGPELDPGYLYVYFETIDLPSLSDGSNVPQINHGDIAPLTVPLPPLADQRRIVARVEVQLAAIDALRGAIERAQRRSKSLRRAVLERAFRGELVAQDPADEPAETLLARIRAERAAVAAPSGRRRPTGK